MSSRASTPGYWFTPDSNAAAPAYPFRGHGIGVPRLRDVLERHRDARIIIELKTRRRRAGAPDDRRRPRGGRARARRARLLPRTRAEGGAALRAAHSDRRGQRRDAVGALPLAGALAARPHDVPRVPGARAVGIDGDRHPAVHRARAPRRPAGTHLDRRRARRTWCGCWSGAPTASSATGRMSRCRSCGSGRRRQTGVDPVDVRTASSRASRRS